VDGVDRDGAGDVARGALDVVDGDRHLRDGEAAGRAVDTQVEAAPVLRVRDRVVGVGARDAVAGDDRLRVVLRDLDVRSRCRVGGGGDSQAERKTQPDAADCN